VVKGPLRIVNDEVQKLLNPILVVAAQRLLQLADRHVLDLEAFGHLALAQELLVVRLEVGIADGRVDAREVVALLLRRAPARRPRTAFQGGGGHPPMYSQPGFSQPSCR
jgi:hypothetical protein